MWRSFADETLRVSREELGVLNIEDTLSHVTLSRSPEPLGCLRINSVKGLAKGLQIS
jgi:hypothetical protein